LLGGPEKGGPDDPFKAASGRSSVVERHVANVNVVGSSPIARSNFLSPERLDQTVVKGPSEAAFCPGDRPPAR
jgi:hypothetical protein